MKLRTKLELGIVFLIFLVTIAPSMLAQQAAVGGETVTPSAAAPSRLRIGPGDLLQLSVFDVPEMAQTVRVTDTGDTSLNLVGSLHLAGLTTDQAQALIAHKLQAGNFILDPHVSVLISEYSTQGVSVLGEVNKPGVYRVLASRSLLEIISEAGGTTAEAGSQATIEHADGTVVTFNLTRNARSSLAADLEILPGDKVVIPRTGLVYVLGDVGRPGGFLMPNDGKITVLQAVAMAGGTNRTASMNHVRLIRKTDSGYQDLSLQLKKIIQGNIQDYALQTEDVVFIPTSGVKSAIYRTAPDIISATSGAAVYHGLP